MYTSDYGGHDLSRPEYEFSILEILATLLRRRALVIGVIAVTTGLSALVALRRPTMYTSSVAFLPESSEAGGGGALALARRFGVATPSQNGQHTPDFYVNLVTSVEVLRQMVTKSYV